MLLSCFNFCFLKSVECLWFMVMSGYLKKRPKICLCFIKQLYPSFKNVTFVGQIKDDLNPHKEMAWYGRRRSFNSGLLEELVEDLRRF